MTQAYPLAWPEGWPCTPETKRLTNSRFSTTFDKARRMLLNELRMLGARDVVVSSWLPLRNDGQPRADIARRRLESPAVAVYFTLRGRPMVMARDSYWNVHDNLHSIGHAINHLRGLERHGGAAMLERAFEGFAALPPPKHFGEILDLTPGAIVTEEVIEQAYRRRAKKLHPDVGGSAAAFAELAKAHEDALRAIRTRAA